MTDQLTFNVADYLDESDMKRIAAEEFRAACARSSQGDFERIISNSAYYLVGDLVDQHFDGRLIEALKAKAIQVVFSLSASTVFSPPNAWDRQASKGFEHMQSALDQLKPEIHERVKQIIASYSSADLRELIEAQVAQAIMAKLAS